VKRSIKDLLKEGGLGAVLTGLMVLLFLRDWRSAFIVVINIPLSLLAAAFALWVSGQNIHLMTLGGMALAVGILVDEATVAVENIHAHLKSIAVDKGDTVQAGQALGEIEVPELLADLAKYRAELRVAELDFKRLNAAREKAPDLVTPQAVDDATGKMEIAKANLERIDTLLRYSRLTAPFGGVVTMRYVDAGAFIPAATSGSAAGAAVLTIMDFNTVRAQVAVPEIDAAFVSKEQPVKISVEGLRGKMFEAKVTRHSYALDDASKTMLVEADLPNPDLALRPGMYATVRIGVEKHAGVLLLPVEAILVEKAGVSVFAVAEGKAIKTPVQIGFNDGAFVEIVKGLPETSPVVLVGKMTLVNGQAVNVTEAK